MKKLLLLLIATMVTSAAWCDYLVTNRKVSIKREPSRQSAPLIQVEANTALVLLDDGIQTNGYYRVNGALFNGDGWIYRTFVRRYRGTLPEPAASDDAPYVPSPNEHVEVRVVDVGQGLCNLVKLPGNKYMIYDAGHYMSDRNGNISIRQIAEYIEPGSEIELMVLSHTDGDHIGAAGEILEQYRVKKLLWTGYEGSMISDEPSGVFTRFITALNNHPEIENVNLHEMDSTITPGTQVTIGGATLTFLCGFGEPEPDWGLSSKSEKLNSVSIVMKLAYEGNSVLFCGDAVGKHDKNDSHDDDVDTPIATEKYLLDNASSYLQSNIIIAPHHGANNASSTAFIDRVDPDKVIFSAGRRYDHPRRLTAERYLNFVSLDDIYRTDRGDDESARDDDEWSYLRINNCDDRHGDDDINIVLRANGTYTIYYLSMIDPCEEEI